MGFHSGRSNIKGRFNVMLGYEAGFSNDTSWNTFIGYQAGRETISGGSNVFLGYQAGKTNTSGHSNVYIGNAAGFTSNARSNVFIGTWAGLMSEWGEFSVMVGASSGYYSNGNRNVLIGFGAGQYFRSGDDNVCIGRAAGACGWDGENGNISMGNVLIGRHAAGFYRIGDSNVCIGDSAARFSTGAYNVIVGPSAGRIAGSYNVFIGNGAGNGESGSNKLYISNSMANSANALIYGEFDNKKLTLNANVGIGTTTPSSTLDVNGSFRVMKNYYPTSGVGIEVVYDPTNDIGAVYTYNRNTSTWKTTRLGGNITPLLDNTFDSGTSDYRWKTIYAVNGTIQTSDVRSKKNISTLNYGLESILKLNPVSFSWKNEPDDSKHLGLVAQEGAGIIKEVVNEGDDPDKTLGINYAQIVPVLIKGIQEQQQQIESTKQENQKLRSELDELRAMVNDLAASQTRQGNK